MIVAHADLTVDLHNEVALVIIAVVVVMVDKAHIAEALIAVTITVALNRLVPLNHALLAMTSMTTSVTVKAPAVRTRKKKAGT